MLFAFFLSIFKNMWPLIFCHFDVFGIKFESLVLCQSQMIRETYLAHTNDGIRWLGFSCVEQTYWNGLCFFQGACGIKLFRVITFILWWSTFFLFKDENAYDYSKNECFTHSSVHWMVWVWNNVNAMLWPSVSPDVSPTKWLWDCAKLHHDHKNTKWGDIFSLLVSENFRINAYVVVVVFF